MAFLIDAALDAGLAYIISNGDSLVLTNAEATTYTEAVTTFNVTDPEAVTPGAAAAGAVSGRRTIIPSVEVTANATDDATHWALTNGTDTLIATGALASPIALTDTLAYTVEAFSITLLDAIAE